ncbi:MAG: hypothetical protein RLZZ339_1999 [Cyanobacteriota bacterium]|jgi:hypothetical protein|uniref:DNA gyrase subunit A n=1 Tax=Microcystis aeruginosa NIES-44 TaxID=449439 RepID=A0A0A1VV72_MICAE|nr:DNA gyrase subunit A [Microcystis aeruginosa NIES-44]
MKKFSPPQMKEVSFPTRHTRSTKAHAEVRTESGVSGFVALFFSTSLCTARRIMQGF